MILKKYRPAFFEGFEEKCYEVNSKEELLSSELCKGWIQRGFEICLIVQYNGEGSIMAIIQSDSEKGATWWTVSNVSEEKVKILKQWLPDFYDLRKKYENKGE